MILMKHHTLYFQKLGKMSQNLLSAAVVIGALRVNLSKKDGLQGAWLIAISEL